MQHIVDLRAEAADLHELLAHLPEADWATPTQFKGWTINDVIIHLHAGDLLAAASVRDAEVFGAMLASIRAARQSGLTSIEENRKRIGPLSGARLLEAWRSQLDELCTALASKDPDARLTWAGPDMGVRMFTTARQMEIWAHGQEVYDVLGEERASTDRLKSIAVIGVRTYGWTFANRGLPVPGKAPHVQLTSPSGDLWTWNPPSSDNRVEGSALDFCQVVTQVRNIADTRLDVTGEPARLWMDIAQCFAGPPEIPPMPGTRHRTRTR
jgi:uncharacterized protein (TIGR03084 family)